MRSVRGCLHALRTPTPLLIEGGKAA